MIEYCFNFLNMLPWADESVYSIALCLHRKKLFYKFQRRNSSLAWFMNFEMCGCCISCGRGEVGKLILRHKVWSDTYIGGQATSADWWQRHRHTTVCGLAVKLVVGTPQQVKSLPRHSATPASQGMQQGPGLIQWLTYIEYFDSSLENPLWVRRLADSWLYGQFKCFLVRVLVISFHSG